MNYLVPLFNCFVGPDYLSQLNAGAKYQCDEFKNEKFFLLKNGDVYPQVISADSKNVVKVKFKKDNYFFIMETNSNTHLFSSWIFKDKTICLTLSEKMFVSIDGEILIEENVGGLKYSHHSIEKEFCFIFFEGERNYVVCLKSNEVVFSSYYDECNIKENEKYFMCRLNDLLNHGNVFHIKGEEFVQYLVYLDNESLNLKCEFLPMLFFDCLKAGNLKYCNSLLGDDLKFEDENQIKEFFSEFDFAYPIDALNVVLIKKNTLAGIYSFQIENNFIVNISNLI